MQLNSSHLFALFLSLITITSEVSCKPKFTEQVSNPKSDPGLSGLNISTALSFQEGNWEVWK